MPEPAEFEVVVIGAGPAGLSAALNLVRARRRVLLIDSNRPRNAATLRSHGFITRDGISPLELRALGRAEIEGYPDATVVGAIVTAVVREGDRFHVTGSGIRGGVDVDATADTVVIAAGLTETFPRVPSLRAHYGTNIHSCIECDGFEKADAPIALIGETGDLTQRALQLTQWSHDLIVFTNGSDAVPESDEAVLARVGVRVERRPIDDLVGERGQLTGVRLQDGTVVPRTAGFVRPFWTAAVAFADSLGLRRDGDGLLAVSAEGATSEPGVWAAGDVTPPGPEQLIIAAGEGARVAASVSRWLLQRRIAPGRARSGGVGHEGGDASGSGSGSGDGVFAAPVR